jgi:glutamate N-acetyltransferase/amino-acid N-acetyltransferase
MKIIKGGVTAPKGFLAAAVSCGIKKSKRNDLAFIYSKIPCVTTGVFTTNRVKSGSVVLSMERIRKGAAQAVIVNSGNANCCVGEKEILDAKAITEIVSDRLELKQDSVLIASTGIIGRSLPAGKIKKTIPLLLKDLSKANGHKFARAIMTTDTVPKEIALEMDIGGRTVVLAGAVKGAGMIHPKMATMLAFFTSDIAIEKRALSSAFKEAVSGSFNRISVDGDMSTNDTAIILANGLAGNVIIRKGSVSYRDFLNGLKFVAEGLAKKIVLDGEGATKFIEIIVKGARRDIDADRIARRIANSSLIKTMIAGGDPNWGRIAAAVGSSGVKVEQTKMDVYFGNRLVMKDGKGVNIARETLLGIFTKKEINIIVDLKSGNKSAKIWTCDLTEEYVRINAEYES